MSPTSTTANLHPVYKKTPPTKSRTHTTLLRSARQFLPLRPTQNMHPRLLLQRRCPSSIHIATIATPTRSHPLSTPEPTLDPVQKTRRAGAPSSQSPAFWLCWIDDNFINPTTPCHFPAATTTVSCCSYHSAVLPYYHRYYSAITSFSLPCVPRDVPRGGPRGGPRGVLPCGAPA